MSNSRRVAFLDSARALSMIWIVGIWHMGAYAQSSFDVQNVYTNFVTTGVLSTFTFISGFFLGGGIKDKKEIVRFYLKRFKRFYPLFFVSCVSLYAAHLISEEINFIESFSQLVLTITGLACFIGEMPLTVWYFSMIMIFYVLTPVITLRRTKGRILSALIIWAVLIVLNLVGYSDERVVLYFPVYCMGLIASGQYGIFEKLRNWNCILVAAASVGLVVLNARFYSNIALQLAANICIMIFIIGVSKIITVKYTVKFFYIISYVSMCAYLFHRQFFGCVKLIFGELPYVALYIVVLPVFLAGCYLLQWLYDKGCNFIDKNSFV